MSKGERNHTTITIPKQLYEKLNKMIKDTGFSSVSSYVTFVMREILTDRAPKDEKMEKEDKKRVKERLRALGYID